ncbi:hypothetical protein Sjap_000463 [Stephania japonica]|uniref:Uncharacterized protein n=1 Tax=Stephania japonica TaxID=461633 RepID=A0AAP0KI26_9MAGN
MPDHSSSYWFTFRFFARIRRFLQLQSSNHTHESTHQQQQQQQQKIKIEQEEQVIMIINSEEEQGSLQRSVKQLHFGTPVERDAAAIEISRLASKDLKTRKSLVELGVVPNLVSMVGLDQSLDRQRLGVRALIELANGTFTNKAVMVEAGIISKIPENIDALDPSIRRSYTLLLLSISSIAKSQFSIPLTEMIPFLISALINAEVHMDVKTLCVESIHNLSFVLENSEHLVSNRAVHTLLNLSLEKETSEKALATLGNLVVSMMGRKAMEDESMVPESLIEIMTWESEPKCQELSAYILMILAHQSSAQRAKMAQLGIVQVLLEVALLGSPLAQKRALKVLQWFKDERQVRIGAHSGPQTGRVATGSPLNRRDISEGREIIKSMVKQSLDRNMELITRRANVGGDDMDCKLKSLVVSSSSKSLPY